MEDLIILYSGGADSRLMIEIARISNRKPYCILIDYEQLHKVELNHAASQLNHLGIPWQVVNLHKLNIESGLTNGVDNESGVVNRKHVPSRNLMFVGIAASIAESKGIDTIWYGADWSDTLNQFPDCTGTWVQIMNNVLSINGPNPIKLEAPLLGLTKDTILRMLEEYGVDSSELFSGYGVWG